jgi:5'-3' exonuclease
MGVPRVFQWIVRKYPATFIKRNLPAEKKCSYLCYDVNGLLHPCVRKSILDKGEYNIKDIRKSVREKMHELANICKPTKGILICIDGVAPVAKMLQQRYRRFKTVGEKEIERHIYTKNGLTPPFSWDTNAITPSTEFMAEMNTLFTEISDEMRTKYPSCDVYYSSSDEPGEGEHKIMDKLRTVDYKDEDSIYIHGLDADLIFLSIGLEKDNIYLMRENGSGPIGYLDVSSLKEKLFVEVQALTKASLTPRRVEKDFMVISYFLGNDFLPQIFSSEVNDLSKLLNIYAEVIDKNIKYLVDDGKIQWDVLSNICEKIGESEYVLVKNRVKNFMKMRISDDDIENPIDKEIFWEKQKPREDPLKLLEPGWKDRFYMYYFDFAPNDWNKKNNMILNYLEGLQWNLNYYLKGANNWLWSYKYHAAPFFSDIYHYLTKRGTTQIVKNCYYVSKNTNKPSSIEQLLVVLPPQSIALIPEKYRYLMNDVERSDIIDLYPIGYKLEYYYKQRDWEHKPKLPDVEFSRIQRIFQN